jgi:D-amino peptidase
VKIFMHWDMEGTSGLFMREQTWYWEKGVREYVAAEGRQLLMADVNAACAAALAAGADELIVCDSHHGGGNLDLERMPRDPRIHYAGGDVGYQDGKLRYIPGLDHTVDYLMLPGHHAKAGSEGAFLPHTWMREWADFRINGQSVGEIGIETCYAGYWDIPLILVQGDEATCAEAQEQFPGVVTACVKRAVSHDLCTGMDPDEARRLTALRIGEAIEKARAGELHPYKPTLPMTVTVRMKSSNRMTSTESVQRALARPGVEMVDDYTVEGHVERQCDVVKWILGTGLDMPAERH